MEIMTFFFVFLLFFLLRTLVINGRSFYHVSRHSGNFAIIGCAKMVQCSPTGYLSSTDRKSVV